jgi:hypothetical protein
MAHKDKPEGNSTVDLGREDAELTETQDQVEAQPASARNMPRPLTVLPAAPEKKVGTCTIVLLGDPSLYPSLDEVERFNKSGDSDARTPLSAVITALVKKAGGTITIEDLTQQVAKYWDRPFPSSPYTLEEFLYMIARNSDNMRVS